MPAGVPGRVAAIAHQSVGAAYVAADKVPALGHPGLGQSLQHAATNAFLRGLTVGSLVAGGVAVAGAVLAVLFLPAQLTLSFNEAGTTETGEPGKAEIEPRPAATIQ